MMYLLPAWGFYLALALAALHVLASALMIVIAGEWTALSAAALVYGSLGGLLLIALAQGAFA